MRTHPVRTGMAAQRESARVTTSPTSSLGLSPSQLPALYVLDRSEVLAAISAHLSKEGLTFTASVLAQEIAQRAPCLSAAGLASVPADRLEVLLTRAVAHADGVSADAHCADLAAIASDPRAPHRIVRASIAGSRACVAVCAPQPARAPEGTRPAVASAAIDAASVAPGGRVMPAGPLLTPLVSPLCAQSPSVAAPDASGIRGAMTTPLGADDRQSGDEVPPMAAGALDAVTPAGPMRPRAAPAPRAHAEPPADSQAVAPLACVGAARAPVTPPPASRPSAAFAVCSPAATSRAGAPFSAQLLPSPPMLQPKAVPHSGEAHARAAPGGAGARPAQPPAPPPAQLLAHFRPFAPSFSRAGASNAPGASGADVTRHAGGRWHDGGAIGGAFEPPVSARAGDEAHAPALAPSGQPGSDAPPLALPRADAVNGDSLPPAGHDGRCGGGGGGGGGGVGTGGGGGGGDGVVSAALSRLRELARRGDAQLPPPPLISPLPLPPPPPLPTAASADRAARAPRALSLIHI